jgi:hypothetical protein
MKSILVIKILFIILVNGKSQSESQYSFESNNKRQPLELGIQIGHFMTDGDVDTEIPGGYGLGLHLRRSINYVFSIKADFFYGLTKGLEPQPWAHSKVNTGQTESVGGGLIESVFTMYDPANKLSDGYWFPSYKSTQIRLSIHGLINMGNYLFQKKDNNWSWYLGLGVGLYSRGTKLNLLDENDLPYNDLISKTSFSANKFDTHSGRKAIKNLLRDIYDDTYESEGPKKAGIFRLGNETNIHPVFLASVAITRKLNDRFSITLEHQASASDDDYIDGIRFRTADDLTADVDMQHYTNLKFNIVIGKTEELRHWKNPISPILLTVDSLKSLHDQDLGDDDKDGIINEMDLEKNTPNGFRVDMHGVSLDSDNDGIVNSLDNDPFHSKNEKKPCCIDEKQVSYIIDTKLSAIMQQISKLNKQESNCGKWFIPNLKRSKSLNEWDIESLEKLHHIATIMDMCPDICLSIKGYEEDKRYESIIAYLMNKYSISNSRFKKGNQSKEINNIENLIYFEIYECK